MGGLEPIRTLCEFRNLHGKMDCPKDNMYGKKLSVPGLHICLYIVLFTKMLLQSKNLNPSGD